MDSPEREWHEPWCPFPLTTHLRQISWGGKTKDQKRSILIRSLVVTVFISDKIAQVKFLGGDASLYNFFLSHRHAYSYMHVPKHCYNTIFLEIKLQRNWHEQPLLRHFDFPNCSLHHHSLMSPFCFLYGTCHYLKLSSLFIFVFIYSLHQQDGRCL